MAYKIITEKIIINLIHLVNLVIKRLDNPNFS